MRKRLLRRNRIKARFALALAWIAGLVDGTGFLLLSHLFTAHMSGNSVAMGVYLGSRSWREFSFRALPLPAFLLGLIVGGTLVQIARRRGILRVFSLAAAVEVLSLIGVIVCGRGLNSAMNPRAALRAPFLWTASLSSLAMGIQSAAFRQVGPLTIRTTYVTGILTKAMEFLVEFGFWIWDRAHFPFRGRRGRISAVAPSHLSLHLFFLYSEIWLFYLFGAVLSALLVPRWGIETLYLALAGLVLVMGMDVYQPIPIP